MEEFYLLDLVLGFSLFLQVEVIKEVIISRPLGTEHGEYRCSEDVLLSSVLPLGGWPGSSMPSPSRSLQSSVWAASNHQIMSCH